MKPAWRVLLVEHKRRCRILSIAWLVVSVCALAATAAQKPVRQVDVHGEGGRAPETLDELWEQSAVVIDGRVVDIRPANQTFTPKVAVPSGGVSAPATLVQTDYVIQVDRVLKSNDATASKMATTIVVRRLGGTVDRGAYVDEYVESNFPKFKRQSRYALFLKPSRTKSVSEPVYLPVVGADSAFEMLGDRVVPLGRSVASQQLAKLGAQQFVATLAQRGGK